jgi:hypothetical protein
MIHQNHLYMQAKKILFKITTVVMQNSKDQIVLRQYGFVTGSEKQSVVVK